MGSGNSRLGRADPTRPRPSRGGQRSTKKLLYSLSFCGGSSSRSTLLMEERSEESHVSSQQNCMLESSLSVTGTVATSSNPENGVLSEISYMASESSFGENGSRETEMKGLVTPNQVYDEMSHDYRNRSSNEASSASFREQPSSDHVSVYGSANENAVNGIDGSDDKDVSHVLPSSSSPEGFGGSHSDGICVENLMCEVTVGQSTVLESIAPGPADVSVISEVQGEEPMEESVTSDIGLPAANREQEGEGGGLLHVDVVSISSSIFAGSDTDISSHETRRNGGRLFLDTLSRRSSRRHMNPPSIVLSPHSPDGPAPQDRWLLDFEADLYDDRFGSDSRNMHSRILSLNERRRQSRSEIWERLRHGLNESDRPSTFCPSGLHPDGACSCGSFLTGEESSTRASISRIVMLAEALFEVLDEIHHQPMSLSLSMSLPAPETVVDSFPLKNHNKGEKIEGRDDVEQCHICLGEYEEGDKIRILPCHHEYHMLCVDKWLKEIHGICPLCRGDVRNAAPNSAATVSSV